VPATKTDRANVLINRRLAEAQRIRDITELHAAIHHMNQVKHQPAALTTSSAALRDETQARRNLAVVRRDRGADALIRERLPIGSALRLIAAAGEALEGKQFRSHADRVRDRSVAQTRFLPTDAIIAGRGVQLRRWPLDKMRGITFGNRRREAHHSGRN